MFSEVVMPILLAVIMFGMGITLTRADFTRLFSMPKSIVIGLVCQLLALPVLGFIVCTLFGLPPEWSIGLMIIAACPGGTMSNIVSQLSKANLSLSISLTALSTLLCVITTPIIIKLASDYFTTGSGHELSIIKVSASIFCITIVPVVLGIAFNEKYPHKAKKLSQWSERLSQVLLAILVVGAVKQNLSTEIDNVMQLVMANITLATCAALIGSGIAIFAGLSRADAFTVGVEAGIQNAGLAIVISLTFLNNPQYAAIATVYGLVMIFMSLTAVAVNKFRNNDNTAYAH